MDRIERLCRLNGELHTRRRPVSVKVLAERLECTERNVKDVIAQLRDMFGAPVRYDREQNGYYLDLQKGQLFELPNLWFNASELHALLTSHRLLTEVQPGLLNEYIEPLKKGIEKLLDDAAKDFQEVKKRVRILQIAARPTNLEHFQKAATALIERRKLKILYHGRARDELSERTVSPQRLVYYRSNWLLDAWCHKANGIRSFSIDRLHPVEILDEPAVEIDDAELDKHFTHSYGIFAGPADNVAHLRFSSHMAKWVADEQWHPQQEYSNLSDGGCELKIPYGNPTELIMDILKYGPDVEVLSPPELREAVVQRIQETAAIYEAKKS
jgi:predicted DNA-binding transcriptional regulator YafY